MATTNTKTPDTEPPTSTPVLPAYDPTSDPFCNLTEELSFYNKAKFFFPGLLILPLRLFCIIFGCTFAMICTKIAFIGVKRSKVDPEPLKGWRRTLATGSLRIGARILLFGLGFLWVKVKGKPVSRKEAPILVANHCAPWEGAALLYVSGCTFVSRIENLYIPLIGPCLRGAQAVFIERGKADSRDSVLHEINRRSTDDRWPILAIFPEGTTGNTRALLAFRVGAFQSGAPVQPVVIRYPFRWMDPTWSGMRLGMGALILRMIVQFYNNIEMNYLPVYHPSEAEKKDPALYAENVRQYISKMSGFALSDYNVEDYYLQQAAQKHGIEPSDALLGMERYKKAMNLSVSDINQVMQAFQNMDVSKSGKIGYSDFIKALGIVDSSSTRSTFAQLCGKAAADGSGKQTFTDLSRSQMDDLGEVDFRHFLQSMLHISRDISTEEKIKYAFEIVDINSDGKIRIDELEAIMSIHSPDWTSEQVAGLFKKIDTRKVGYIDFVEFGSFIRANPSYMQLFEQVRDEQSKLGENPVLDLLAARAEGKSMSVEQFKERISTHRAKHNQSPQPSPLGEKKDQ